MLFFKAKDLNPKKFAGFLPQEANIFTFQTFLYAGHTAVANFPPTVQANGVKTMNAKLNIKFVFHFYNLFFTLLPIF